MAKLFIMTFITKRKYNRLHKLITTKRTPLAYSLGL